MYEVIIELGANASKYWADLAFEAGGEDTPEARGRRAEGQPAEQRPAGVD